MWALKQENGAFIQTNKACLFVGVWVLCSFWWCVEHQGTELCWFLMLWKATAWILFWILGFITNDDYYKDSIFYITGMCNSKDRKIYHQCLIQKYLVYNHVYLHYTWRQVERNIWWRRLKKNLRHVFFEHNFRCQQSKKLSAYWHSAHTQM